MTRIRPSDWLGAKPPSFYSVVVVVVLAETAIKNDPYDPKGTKYSALTGNEVSNVCYRLLCVKLTVFLIEKEKKINRLSSTEYHLIAGT